MNFYIKRIKPEERMDYPATIHVWSTGQNWGIYLEGFKYPFFTKSYRHAREQMKQYKNYFMVSEEREVMLREQFRYYEECAAGRG